MCALITTDPTRMTKSPRRYAQPSTVSVMRWSNNGCALLLPFITAQIEFIPDPASITLSSSPCLTTK
eukprot:CAMPEP_0173398334 /NCGR_PEP_ID=MMETSP1356-20130122/41211_1 /TAXON_ID=77927 ORGANISM="Hemiselmis virescens, Strain PCC157" /NCGR_SAMPLE_ID=MMETSP1356 /ASSEMBLY_ACC=CAM_ASM_000847 /LENGTH=66 /DNA_ID=CAMNT_0014357797 /DNA_START=321 /DNA_END=521 /DNA_ORIENTATION=-